MTYDTPGRLGPRTLVALDFENLAGGPEPCEIHFQRIRQIVEGVVGDVPAPIIAACSHHAARTMSFLWPAARWKWRSGRDGADLALLDELDVDWISQRFTRLVLGTGDGIFAGVVSQLGLSGTKVEVVSRRRALSRRLRMAASTSFTFEDLADETGADVA